MPLIPFASVSESKVIVTPSLSGGGEEYDGRQAKTPLKFFTPYRRLVQANSMKFRVNTIVKEESRSPASTEPGIYHGRPHGRRTTNLIKRDTGKRGRERQTPAPVLCIRIPHGACQIALMACMPDSSPKTPLRPASERLQRRLKKVHPRIHPSLPLSLSAPLPCRG